MRSGPRVSSRSPALVAIVDDPRLPYRRNSQTKELTDALRQITRFKKRKGKRELMMLSFADGVLRFSMLNASVGISAKGTWPTDVMALAASIYGLARVPLKEDTIRIAVEGDHLKIGSEETQGSTCTVVTASAKWPPELVTVFILSGLVIAGSPVRTNHVAHASSQR